MYEPKFNTLSIGAIFQPTGDLHERCRKANHYWKRFGRRFAVRGDDGNSHIERIK